ncbi:MAG: tRNA pseudouridine(38-40) synthase TruA [Acidobacteria bacterium]|nr:tRNA pseudouridine(38-40) synthase TruA [Acidobacteriota bacterium]
MSHPPSRHGGARPAGRPRPRSAAAPAASSRPSGPERNIRLLIEYEGTRYAGWQIQKAQRTVMGEILRAIETTLGESPRLIGAGRTDAGVHAEAQVANFLTRAVLPAGGIAESLNTVLPADINVLRAEDALLSFHARHDAVARRYRYQIASRRSAFFKRFIWWVRRPLDLERMKAAAGALLGRHDFTSFADRTAEIPEPRVRVFAAGLRGGDFLTSFTIEADHFLPRMVRRIVGVLVQIGLGELPPEAIARYLHEVVDDPARWTAPPSGLFLERVLYPAEGGPGLERGPRRVARPCGSERGRRAKRVWRAQWSGSRAQQSGAARAAEACLAARRDLRPRPGMSQVAPLLSGRPPVAILPAARHRRTVSLP